LVAKKRGADLSEPAPFTLFRSYLGTYFSMPLIKAKLIENL
jgi:hypothetical protein